MQQNITRRELIRIGSLSLATAGSSLGAAGCTSEQRAPVASAPKVAESPVPAPSPARVRPAKWDVVLAQQTGGGDPSVEYGTNAQFYLPAHVLEPPMHIGLLPDGSGWGIVNDLAESWSVPDSKTLVVKLKQGIKFHNGEALTAEHVKYSYDSVVKAEKPGRRADDLKGFGEAEVVDQYTVQWHTPSVGGALSEIDKLLVVPLARKQMTVADFEKKPIGTGPYKAIDWARDGLVQLEAWDAYRMGKAFPTSLTFRYVPEPTTRFAELTAGSTQISQNPSLDALPAIQGNPQFEVTTLKGNLAMTYVINIYKASPPLRDKRIRQAMNYAVDRDTIVKTILSGRGAALSGPLSPGWMGYTEDVKPFPHDPDKAKALLKEAGYPDGFSFNWTITQGVFTKDIEVAQAVANQLAQVGIRANLQPMERARLLADRNNGDYDVTELGWAAAWDPTAMFRLSLVNAYPDDKLGPKWGAAPAELLDAKRLLNEASATADPGQKEKIFVQLNRLMHDNAFWLFVHTVDEVYGIQRDIGWRPFPVPTNLYERFYDHWLMLGKKAPVDPNVPLIVKS